MQVPKRLADDPWVIVDIPRKRCARRGRSRRARPGARYRSEQILDGPVADLDAVREQRFLDVAAAQRAAQVPRHCLHDLPIAKGRPLKSSFDRLFSLAAAVDRITAASGRAAANPVRAADETSAPEVCDSPPLRRPRRLPDQARSRSRPRRFGGKPSSAISNTALRCSVVDSVTARPSETISEVCYGSIVVTDVISITELPHSAVVCSPS